MRHQDIFERPQTWLERPPGFGGMASWVVAKLGCWEPEESAWSRCHQPSIFLPLQSSLVSDGQPHTASSAMGNGLLQCFALVD